MKPPVFGLVFAVVLSSPAAAALHEIHLQGTITESLVKCSEGQVCSSVGRPVGAPVTLIIRINASPETENLTVMEVNFSFSASNFYGNALGGTATFDSKKLVAASLFFDGVDDVCGGGGPLSFADGVFAYTSRYCGYDDGIDPLITEKGSGQVVGYTVNGAQVPEPATWALMILGFGTAGTALRRQPRVARARCTSKVVPARWSLFRRNDALRVAARE